MSIDRIRHPGVDGDVDKPEPARPPTADSRRPRRSVNEEYLDAMDEGRVIGRDDPREHNDGDAGSDLRRSSDVDTIRSPAADTPGVRKSVNEMFLDAMDERRVIRPDDTLMTVGEPSRGEIHASPDEPVDGGKEHQAIDLADRDLDDVRRTIKEEGLGPGDELYDALQELNDAEKRQMGRIWSTFPKGSDDTTKAGWYREAAKAEGIPDYMRPILDGRGFNHEMYPTFRASEVTIHKIDPDTGERVLKKDGKTPITYRVDGLRKDEFGGDEVISVKSTQIAEKPEVARKYIDEMVKKYNPSDIALFVAPTGGNKKQLKGDEIGAPLKGVMVLVVPEQNAPIPQEILDYAEDSRVKIRTHSSTHGGTQ